MDTLCVPCEKGDTFYRPAAIAMMNDIYLNARKVSWFRMIYCSECVAIYPYELVDASMLDIARGNLWRNPTPFRT